MLDLRSTRNWTRPYIYIYISCTRHNPNSSLHRYLFPRISLSEACNMKTYKYVTSFSAYELWSSPIVVPSLVPFSLRSAVWTWFSSRHSFVKRNLPKANSRSWGLKSRALIIDRANLLIFSIVYIYISRTIIVAFSILLVSSRECTWLAIIEHPLSTWSIVFGGNNLGELCTTSWRYCRPSIRYETTAIVREWRKRRGRVAHVTLGRAIFAVNRFVFRAVDCQPSYVASILDVKTWSRSHETDIKVCKRSNAFSIRHSSRTFFYIFFLYMRKKKKTQFLKRTIERNELKNKMITTQSIQ